MVYFGVYYMLFVLIFCHYDSPSVRTTIECHCCTNNDPLLSARKTKKNLLAFCPGFSDQCFSEPDSSTQKCRSPMMSALKILSV